MNCARRWGCWGLAGAMGLAVVSARAWADEPARDTLVVAEAAEAEAAEVGEAASETAAESTGARPTHKQSALIAVNATGLPEASVQCFCLTSDNRLLAACKGQANEIRVFNEAGQYTESIELPLAPEAINVAPDGTILVAGAGQLLRLSTTGEVMAQEDSPHAAAILARKVEIREQAIAQHKQQAESLPQMLEAYDTAITQLEGQLETLKSQDKVEQQIAEAEQMLDAYRSAKEQIAAQYGGEGVSAELTEEQIDELVKAAMQQTAAIASISASDDAVFIACRMPVGYAYEVWRLSTDFAEGQMIASDLSGCCGQMDVQANDDGVFVAENSRKRVRRFDADGTSICDWGKSSEGVDGFGSCCNPMNLAFGSDGSVYTAEDTTGRIKRYSVDGDLLSVVGAADVVPGCKKVSIGVDATGDRVYMLDITRNNVAVLSRVLPDPTGPISEAEMAESGGGGGGFGGLIRGIFGG